MNKLVRILILIAVIVYAVSPVDLMPGPIDDLIVLVAGAIGTRQLRLAA